MTTMARPNRLSTASADGETRILVPGVGFRVYELWVGSLPECSPVRMAYDGRSMELMVKGRKHDNYRELLGEVVRAITQELDLPMSSSGETTWIRPEIERGLEADQSYYFLPEKLAAAGTAKARGSNDVADYPNPDLAIEVDISPPQVDRTEIYAKLQVAELWRFDGRVLTIERLDDQGRYLEVEASLFLKIRSDQVTSWLIAEDSSDETAWSRRLRAWIRSELAGRDV